MHEAQLRGQDQKLKDYGPIYGVQLRDVRDEFETLAGFCETIAGSCDNISERMDVLEGFSKPKGKSSKASTAKGGALSSAAVQHNQRLHTLESSMETIHHEVLDAVAAQQKELRDELQGVQQKVDGFDAEQLGKVTKELTGLELKVGLIV